MSYFLEYCLITLTDYQLQYQQQNTELVITPFPVLCTPQGKKKKKKIPEKKNEALLQKKLMQENGVFKY